MITSFQERVFEAVRNVPASRVCSYSTLASWIGCRSARAVGQALRANPFAPQVPCHRVVASDGSLGGYFGQSAGDKLAIKRNLLEGEGVPFTASGRVDRSAFLE